VLLSFSSWTNVALQASVLNRDSGANSSTCETLVAAMSRRSRNSRAWRYVWGGIRRDADARALVLASETEEWGYDRLEVSIHHLKRDDASVEMKVLFIHCRSYVVFRPSVIRV